MRKYSIFVGGVFTFPSLWCGPQEDIHSLSIRDLPVDKSSSNDVKHEKLTSWIKRIERNGVMQCLKRKEVHILKNKI